LLRRSNYGTKNRMQAIAKIKLSHQAFREILNQSVETHWNKDVFLEEDDWSKKLHNSDVIHQWDPERDLVGKRLDRQAIQIGIRGAVIKITKSRGTNFPQIPMEKEYVISESLFEKLGCEREG